MRVLRARLAVLVTVAACSAPQAGAPHPSNAAAAGSLERARAYERGVGVARDYARAVEIYKGLCRSGHGSLEACVALIDAIAEGRGIDHDIPLLDSVLHELCQRGDAVSCVDETLELQPVGGLSEDENPVSDASARELAARMKVVASACAQGDGRACEMVATDETGDVDTDAVRADHYRVACESGRLEACAAITHGLEACEHDDHPASCEAEQLAEWKSKDARAYAAANVLVQACDGGDAMACVHVPSKRVPLPRRCAAHDYAACADLGCLGDAASGQIAKQHGVETSCRVARPPGGAM